MAYNLEKNCNFLGFYYIDKSYADYLRDPKIGDKHIPVTEYENRSKFFVGAIITVNNLKYYAPVSSYVGQNDATFNICDTHGEILSSVRLNYMFPVVDGVYTKIDINNLPYGYRRLVLKEYQYCNKHSKDIVALAELLYKTRNKGCNYTQDKMYINNFAKLEKAAMNYKPAVKTSLQNPIADKYGLTEEQYDIAKKFAEKFGKPLEQVIRSNIAFAPDSHYDSSIKSNVIAEEAAKRKQQKKTQEKNNNQQPASAKPKKKDSDYNCR